MAKRGIRGVRQFAVAAVALIVLGGCGLLGGGKHDDTANAAPAADQSSVPATQATTEEVPLDPVTTKPTPRKTKATQKPSDPAPTEQPFWEQLPACAHKDSSKPVSMSKVKAALKVAAGRIYWTHEAPQLKLNYPLVKAVSWMESGWQSNIHNCDGGQGIMQVMPGTVTMINNRFGLAYDASDYKQNAQVGANYLAWLTRYVGDKYFKDSYDLSPSKCKTSTSWCELNLVISGYNAGQGALDDAGATKTLPNPQYVSTVRALMSRCKCDQY